MAAKKKVRVLAAHYDGNRLVNHGEVIELEDSEIKARAGLVDPHPDAVAYQEGVNAEAEKEAAKNAPPAAAKK